MPKRNITSGRFQLLLAFDAIARERSVSAAVDVLGMSQSAVSKQLRRLRTWFDDELFVRTPGGMEPTPRALAVAGDIKLILASLDNLGTGGGFAPKVTETNLSIATTDEVSSSLLGPMLRLLDERAPRARLTFKRLEMDFLVRQLEAGSVDAVITIAWGPPSQLRQRHLFSDRFVCLLSEANPLATGRLTLKRYAAAKHLMVAPFAQTRGYIDGFLADKGHRRFMRLSVPEFSLLSGTLFDDATVATVPERVAVGLAEAQGLRIKPLPIDVPPLSYRLFWHERFHRDPRNRWLRALVVEAFGR